MATRQQIMQRLRQTTFIERWEIGSTTFATVSVLPGLLLSSPANLDPITFTLHVISYLIMVLRHRLDVPLLAPILTLALALIATHQDHGFSVSWIFAEVCLISITMTGTRAQLTFMAITTTVAIYLAFTDFAVTDIYLLVVLISASITGAVMGISLAIRSQQATADAYRDLATQAIQSRESEAQRRVADERLRIARELHDAVAHHIAVIGMLTGLARTKLPDHPEEVEASLSRVQDATRSVLTEMQDILRVLRSPDTALDASLEEPVPGVSRLAALIDSFREIGMLIDLTAPIPEELLTTTVDAVAYRVMQEALTNAQRHGTGSITITPRLTPTTLTLTFANPVARGRQHNGDGSGFGLIGMTERVQAVGGTIRRHVVPDAYVLAVALPRRPDPEIS